jgi:Golgi phosphoprotein 3 (GPP34)
MEPPDSLPARLYLLAYDLRRARPTGHLAVAVRAAALEDLRLQGHLSDDAGRVRVRDPRPLADPVLDTVLREAGQGRPRPWKHWVAARSRQTGRAVRDQLDDRLYLRVEHHRVLGIFPRVTVTARDPRVIERLQHTVVQALTRGPAVSHVDPQVAALVAFAALAEFDSIFPRRLRREHKTRIGEFAERVAPVGPALKKVIDELHESSESTGC